MTSFDIITNPDAPQIQVGKMACDMTFEPKPPEPCPDKSFCWCIVGSRGSGKSTFLRSILSSKKKESRIYYKVFHSIIVCMPELSRKSMTPDPFKGIPREDIYEEFNEEFMDEVEQKVKENAEEGIFTLLVFDDISNALRNNRTLENRITKLVHLSRHFLTSTIFLIQKFKDIPNGIRQVCDLTTLFLPSNYQATEAFNNEYLKEYNREEQKKLFDLVFKKKGDTLTIRKNIIPNKMYANLGHEIKVIPKK